MKKIIIIIFLFISIPVLANSDIDTDGDRIIDLDEKNVYYTDYQNSDTDGDGYNDWLELNNDYSPHNPDAVKLEDNDTDNDGLSDRMELNFHTNLIIQDTDGDGYLDGDEIKYGYDPLDPERAELDKRIEINTGDQELSYFLGGVRMEIFPISSGINNSTPKGYWSVINKHPKAWSPYGLWMPYWMGLGTGKFGLHELPIWPNGYREGEDHLGIPVSHGCIRLGIGSAEFLYNWAEVGTPVFIY
jgi:hypothetical protein